jgi:hypothetical protein
MSKLRITWPFIDEDRKEAWVKKDWIKESNWFKGIHTNVNIILKSLHEKDNNKYFFNIFAISGKNDILLNDTFIIDNPKLNTLEEEIDFHQYLKCLVSMATSDIRLMCDNVFIVGPSGIINCKSNEEQNESEIYQLENKEEFYTTKYTRFLNFINEQLHMDEIINNSYNSESSFLDIPFLNTKTTFKVAPFGCTQMISLVRREKHGDLIFNKKYLKYDTDHIYIPSEKILKEYHLNGHRMTLLYKALLDLYILNDEKNPEEYVADVNFSINFETYERKASYIILEKE